MSEAAQRLGIARSTAHRLLTMLVYRDFAVQDESRVLPCRPGAEKLAAHSPSEASRLRTIALPHLHHVVDVLDESANLIARTARPHGSSPGSSPRSRCRSATARAWSSPRTR